MATSVALAGHDISVDRRPDFKYRGSHSCDTEAHIPKKYATGAIMGPAVLKKNYFRIKYRIIELFQIKWLQKSS